MKQLKCKSCGGTINIEENNNFGTCPYCGSKYKLNEDVNININLDDNIKETMKMGFGTLNNVFKFMLIPLIIFIITFLIITFSTFKIGNNIFNKNFNVTNKVNENTSKDDNRKDYFNLQFMHRSGTKPLIIVEDTIDKIVESNKTNNHLITLKYNNKKTTDEEEILNIKHSLNKENYEILIDYDQNGYINIITIEPLD